MDCQECNEKLSLYLDHELTPEEVPELKKHLEKCKPCKDEYEKYAETLEKVCHLSCVDAPADFHERFMQRFSRECTPSKGMHFWRTFSLGSVATAAVILLVVVLQKPVPDIQKNVPVNTVSQQSISFAPDAGKKAEILQIPDKKTGSYAQKSVAHSSLSAVEENEPVYPTAPIPQSSARTVIPNSLFKSVAVTSNYYPVASGGGRSQSIPAVAGQPQLVRQTGELSGDDCKITTSMQNVMYNPAEMKTLWKKAAIQNVAPPQIDWKRQMLGSIFLGKKTGRGYEINLLESQRHESQWVVKYKVTPPNIIDTHNLSYPFFIFVLPKTDYPVVFIEE